MDRTELLAQMDAGRARLETALARVDAGELAAPVLHDGWSIKDTLFHIGFWERRAANLYETLRRGDTPVTARSDADVDELNARAYKEGQERSPDEVRSEEAAAHLALRQIAATAPEADLFDPARFPWAEGRAFYNWIEGNSYGHYDEHLPEVMAWLDEVEA
jgi:hypothetical protein